MTSELTRAVARLLFAPALLVALAVLVKGYADVGDGFSAGVIAALAVLLHVLAHGRSETERVLPLRRAPAVALAGLALGLAVAFVPPLLGEPVLTHFPAPGSEPVHVGTLELITAVVFDVGVFLLVLGASVAFIRFAAEAAERRSAR